MAHDYPGARKRFTVVFTDDDDVLADPTTVTLSYRRERDAPTVLVYGVHGAVVRDTTGTYYTDIACETSGTYAARAEGDGQVSAAMELRWEVLPGDFE